MTRRATKLVCTLGPATADRIPELVEAGMDVARINLTHGSREDHEGLVRAVREAADRAGKPVGVMADLSGPKVRLGELAGGEATLEEGATFALRASEGAGDAAGAATSYAGLAGDLEPGDRILLSDGVVELRVERAEGERVVTEVVRGGTIRSRAGVNVPSERLGLPAITPKDERDLEWIAKAEIDLVSQSFVRRPEEVRDLQQRLRDDPVLVVAKIETGAAVAAADGIFAEADVVMIARGDLGVETAPEEIPVIQRDLVSRATRAGVPAIVATQMLESMTAAPRPTRAEASDVAGAVFEGASAILLSAETAIGDYPLEAARTAHRILGVAETQGARFMAPLKEEASEGTDARAVAHAAATAVEKSGAPAVACFTRTGRTAKLLSGVRLPVPVYAFSHEERVVRRLTIFRGVFPFRSELPDHTDGMIAMMERRLREEAELPEGSPIVMVASAPVGRARTNLLKIHRLG